MFTVKHAKRKKNNEEEERIKEELRRKKCIHVYITFDLDSARRSYALTVKCICMKKRQKTTRVQRKFFFSTVRIHYVCVRVQIRVIYLILFYLVESELPRKSVSLTTFIYARRLRLPTIPLFAVDIKRVGITDRGRLINVFVIRYIRVRIRVENCRRHA